MPIICEQVRGELKDTPESIINKARRICGLSEALIKDKAIYKTSLDARKQNDIHFVYSVYFSLGNDADEKSFCERKGYKKLRYIQKPEYSPEISPEKRSGRVVIAGFGPCGMFCALALAEQGYKPIVLERGEEIEKRVASVNSFWSGGKLNTESNVQFGEGGAGTFSDGKLTTRINDPLCGYVMERLVEFGAPKEILTKAKPHIGTDKLRDVVKALRERVISLGGEVHFSTALDNIELFDGRIKSVSFKGQTVETAALVLAVGHSARDTFEMLLSKGIFIESKPFSVGARIEHTQESVDRSLYGKLAGNEFLPKGEYQLSYRDSAGRGVYTFCMCPGGCVVAAQSEENAVVTNGMSYFARDGKNANSALVVSVSHADFGQKPLDGVYFAREIEKKAFSMCGKEYAAPALTVGDFLDGTSGLKSNIIPTYSRGLCPADFNMLFPKPVTDMMAQGLRIFSRRMECFGDKSAILTAPETRTSSPVRITRNADMTSVSAKNLYPAGEGAGYAGGIMSAAVDGLKTASEIMKSFSL